MRTAALALVLMLAAGPALAATPTPAAKATAAPKASPTPKLGTPGRPITAVAKVPGGNAVVAFVVPDVAPLFTCPMHPEEVSDKAKATCSICEMALVPRTHSVRMAFADKEGEPIAIKGVDLELTDKHGLTQRIKMAGKGPFQANFALEKGKIAILAKVKPAKGKPYEVKSAVTL